MAFNHKTPPREAYDNLERAFRIGIEQQHALSVIRPQLVVNPDDTDLQRQAEQLGQDITDTMNTLDIRSWFRIAEDAPDQFNDLERRNLLLMRDHWVNWSEGLNEQLPASQAILTSEGTVMHQRLSQTGQWNQDVQDWFEKSFWFACNVGRSHAYHTTLGNHYNGLVHRYAPGFSEYDVEREFKKLEDALRVMIPKVLEKQAERGEQEKPIQLKGKFPRAQQERLNRHIARQLGFNFQKGQIDFVHRSSMVYGPPHDTRVTIGIPDETTFLKSVISTTHEIGHAIYCQNLPDAFKLMPIGLDLGTAMHESQARLMEQHICRGPGFFKFLSDNAKRFFSKHDDPALEPDNLRRLMYHVEPQYIRPGSDELTYAMHIILRTKIEKAVMNNEGLDIPDIPKAWWEGLEDLLGLEPQETHELGCMYDPHWWTGDIGYFPSYTLGSIMACQFFEAAQKAIPDLEHNIADGNFHMIKGWMIENIHSKGSILTTDELLREVTGKSLDTDGYINHLSRRYLGKDWQPQ